METPYINATHAFNLQTRVHTIYVPRRRSISAAIRAIWTRICNISFRLYNWIICKLAVQYKTENKLNSSKSAQTLLGQLQNILNSKNSKELFSHQQAMILSLTRDIFILATIIPYNQFPSLDAFFNGFGHEEESWNTPINISIDATLYTKIESNYVCDDVEKYLAMVMKCQKSQYTTKIAQNAINTLKCIKTSGILGHIMQQKEAEQHLLEHAKNLFVSYRQNLLQLQKKALSDPSACANVLNEYAKMICTHNRLGRATETFKMYEHTIFQCRQQLSSLLKGDTKDIQKLQLSDTELTETYAKTRPACLQEDSIRRFMFAIRHNSPQERRIIDKAFPHLPSSKEYARHVSDFLNFTTQHIKEYFEELEAPVAQFIASEPVIYAMTCSDA